MKVVNHFGEKPLILLEYQRFVKELCHIFQLLIKLQSFTDRLPLIKYKLGVYNF
jgi:hypothetical protein